MRAAAIQNEGYTFIELLITLTLSSLLLIFSVQGYQHFKAALEARIILSRLFTLINYARSEAIRTGYIVVMAKNPHNQTPFGNWSNGQVVFISKQNPYMLLTFGPIKFGKLEFQGFQSNDFLRFMPSGSTFEQNGSFIYYMNQNTKPTWSLIIEKSGRVRVATF